MINFKHFTFCTLHNRRSHPKFVIITNCFMTGNTWTAYLGLDEAGIFPSSYTKLIGHNTT